MITEKFHKLKKLLLKAKIKKILTKMDDMFRHAIGPDNRREYMMKKGITDRDWHFSLTADARGGKEHTIGGNQVMAV